MGVFVRALPGERPTGWEGWPKCYHVDENCPVLTTARAKADYSNDQSEISLADAEKLDWKPCPTCGSDR